MLTDVEIAAECDVLVAFLAADGIRSGLVERTRVEHVLTVTGIVQGGLVGLVGAIDLDPGKLCRRLRPIFVRSLGQREVFDAAFHRWVRQLPRQREAFLGDARTRSPDYRVPAGSPKPPARSPLARNIVMGFTLVALGGATTVIVKASRLDGDEVTPLEDASSEPEEVPQAPIEADLAPVVEVHKETLETTEVSPWSAVLLLVGLAWTSGLLAARLVEPQLRPAHGSRRILLATPPPPPIGDRLFIDRAAESDLVWGAQLCRADEVTHRLDLRRTVDATAARGGIVDLRYEYARTYRGAWIWIDRRMRAPDDACQLAEEITATLERAELPIRRAYYDGIPDIVTTEGKRAAPRHLGEELRHTRVVLFTDGVDLVRASPLRHQILAELAGWDNLAVVGFGPNYGALSVLLAGFGVPLLRPADVVAHLAGVRPSMRGPAGHDLRVWEAACALAPGSIRETDAEGLRRTLAFDVGVWAIESLRAGARRSRGALVWSDERRARCLAALERAEPFPPSRSPLPIAGVRARGLAFWRQVYDTQIAARAALRADWMETPEGMALQAERLALDLWERPGSAILGLFRLAGDLAARPLVCELIGRHVDRDTEPGNRRVRLPWRLRERTTREQLMLRNLGFGPAQGKVQASPTALGVGGLLALVGGSLLAGSANEGERGLFAALVVTSAAVVFGPALGRMLRGQGWWGRRAHGFARWTGELSAGIAGLLAIVGVSLWPIVDVMKNEVPLEPKMEATSGGVEDTAPERGMDEPHDETPTGGGTTSATDEEEKIESVAGPDEIELGPVQPAKVRRPPRKPRPSPPKAASKAQGADEEMAEREAVTTPENPLDLRAALTIDWQTAQQTRQLPQREPEQPAASRCPPGMVLIPGTRVAWKGYNIPDFCIDRTEVTVAAFTRCVRRDRCRYSGDANSSSACNYGHDDRSQHPINCVTWTEANAYCRSLGRRLPVAVEWEWAARGGNEGRVYPWGKDPPVCDRATSALCRVSGTEPVATKPLGASREGVLDLSGNVREWTATRNGQFMLLKGGDWLSPSTALRVVDTSRDVPEYRGTDVGFRCALAAPMLYLRT